MQFPINEPVADAADVDDELVVAIAAQLPTESRRVRYLERERVRLDGR